MPRIEMDLESIPTGTPHRVERDGRAIVVVRTDSAIHAYQDWCPHAGWRLSDGQVTDGELECPGHGWQFNVSTGGCVTVPAYCLRPVSVTVIGTTVCFEWTERAAVASWLAPWAALGLLPDLIDLWPELCSMCLSLGSFVPC